MKKSIVEGAPIEMAGHEINQSTKHYISAFYHFKKLENLEKIKTDLEQKALELNVLGLLILGEEGFNTTCSSVSRENLEAFKGWVQNYFECSNIFFKDSHAYSAPFRRYKVKIREEIVTTGIPGVMPPDGKNHHLTPSEWNQVLKTEKDWVMIDTRNWYEYKIGSFKGAINPNIEKFTDFPAFMEKQGIKKDQKLLIFCTGGIRCEKGILELQNQGYENVFQLDGGILNYLKEYPDDEFWGECFVFDHRVAVDQKLLPSQQYKLCPHCGQPAQTPIQCVRCDHETLICESCAEKLNASPTCSKNCHNQWEMHPGKKGERQLLPFEIQKQLQGNRDVHDETNVQSHRVEMMITKKKSLEITATGTQLIQKK